MVPILERVMDAFVLVPPFGCAERDGRAEASPMVSGARPARSCALKGEVSLGWSQSCAVGVALPGNASKGNVRAGSPMYLSRWFPDGQVCRAFGAWRVCKSSGHGRTRSGISAGMCNGARREPSVVSTMQHIVSAAGLLRTHAACQTAD